MLYINCYHIENQKRGCDLIIDYKSKQIVDSLDNSKKETFCYQLDNIVLKPITVWLTGCYYIPMYSPLKNETGKQISVTLKIN